MNKQQPEQMEDFEGEMIIDEPEKVEWTDEQKKEFLKAMRESQDMMRQIDLLSRMNRRTSGGNKKYVTKAKAKRLRKLQKQASKVNR